MTESTGRDEIGRFAAGNRIWETRSRAGPKPRFEDPEALWEACVAYFEWVEANPLQEVTLVSYQGDTKEVPVPRMRAMTIEGLTLFLGIDPETWRDWRNNRPDLSGVVEQSERVMREQKFTGAAADLLNPNIIARDLGLADRTEQRHLDRDGKPTDPPSSLEVAKKIAFILAKAKKEISDRKAKGL
ncbi:MAG: terminase small subunit [Pseudomonadota bacterium]